MKITKLFFLASLLLCFFSCNNDDNLNTPQNQDDDPDHIAFAQNFGNEISRTFLGTVVDINNNPIENVTISIGSSTALTDANGVFIINNATVNQRFGYVKAEKAGFIHASRAVVPSEGTNKISITMLAETVVGTTSSGTQETITLQNGASVALDGNYIKPDGSTYSGNVNVIMHHLDPANENMQDQMPGMLYAANAQNEARMLQTYGMLAVELRGDSGEDLNLAEGSTAEITMPLDASLMSTAPSSIPLWYFDEAHGYWVEEGTATLVGNTYVGTVSHFSFWNCDIPAEYVDFCVTVNDSAGNPLTHTTVTLTSVNYGTGSSYTNEIGETCGLIPSEETLEIKVYSYNFCGNDPIYVDTIGPFTEDTNISITVADDPDLISETVTGVFNNCDGNPVTDGYINLRYNNQSFIDIVTNGDFEINLLRCDAEETFTIKASDYVNLQVTDSINYTFTTPLTNLGSIQSCNTIEEFITYQIDNDPEIFITSNFSGTFSNNSAQNSPFLYILSTSNEVPNDGQFYLIIRLNFTPPFTGPYTYAVDTPNSNPNFQFEDQPEMVLTDNNVICYINELGNVGEYIDINFTGDYFDYLGVPHSINGVIHVLRDE